MSLWSQCGRSFANPAAAASSTLSRESAAASAASSVRCPYRSAVIPTWRASVFCTPARAVPRK